MGRKKELNQGKPAWYLAAEQIQGLIQKDPKTGIASHVAQFADQNKMSTRMVKRYMQLKEFLDDHFPDEIDNFTDGTPASLIDELEKIHHFDPEKAKDLVSDCVSGQLIASELKQILKDISESKKSFETINQRSESRQLILGLEKHVKNMLHTDASIFGIGSSFQIQYNKEHLVKPDLSIFEPSTGRMTAIEIKYFAPNASDGVFQQAVCKLNWLDSKRYDQVLLCTLKASKPALEKWVDFYFEWTNKELNVLYF